MKTKLVFLFALSVACYAQTYALAPVAKFQGLDNNGVILSGGLLYSYAAGTSTPIATYTDSSGGTPNSNPVVLDASGRANVWLDTSLAYKFILKNSGGVTLWTVDNIMAGSGGGGGGGSAVGPLGAVQLQGGSGAFSGSNNILGDSNGGVTLNLAANSTVGLTINQYTSPSVDALDVKTNGGSTIFSIGSLGTVTAPGYVGTNASTTNTFQNVGGSPNWSVNGNGLMTATNMTLTSAAGSGAQCIHVNNSGVLSATGAGDCGSGGSGAPGSPSTSVQTNQGGVFTGNAGWEATFSGSVATVSQTGSYSLTSDTAATIPLTVTGASAQTGNLVNFKSNGGTTLADFGSLGTLFGPGAVFTITNSATQGLFVQGAPGQTAHLAEFQDSSSTVLAYVNNVGVGVFPSVTGTGFGNHLDDLTIDSLAGGGTQCLQVGNTGVVSATGSTCGGGGGSPGAPANSVQTNNGSGGFAGSSSFLFSGTTASLNNTLAFITSAGTLDASASGGAFNFVGSTSTNGNFVFSPGNVAANSSVVFNAGRADEPALYAKSQSGTTTGTIFALRNNSNVATVWVMQSGDATCPDCAVFSNKVSIGQATNPSAQLDEVISNAANIGYKLTGANGQSVDYLDVNSFGNTGGNLVSIGNLGTLFAKAGLAVTNGTSTEMTVTGGSGQTAIMLDMETSAGGMFIVGPNAATPFKFYDGAGASTISCQAPTGLCWQMNGTFNGDGQLLGYRATYPLNFPNMSVTSGKTLHGYVPLLEVNNQLYYVAVYQ